MWVLTSTTQHLHIDFILSPVGLASTGTRHASSWRGYHYYYYTASIQHPSSLMWESSQSLTQGVEEMIFRADIPCSQLLNLNVFCEICILVKCGHHMKQHKILYGVCHWRDAKHLPHMKKEETRRERGTRGSCLLLAMYATVWTVQQWTCRTAQLLMSRVVSRVSSMMKEQQTATQTLEHWRRAASLSLRQMPERW